MSKSEQDPTFYSQPHGLVASVFGSSYIIFFFLILVPRAKRESNTHFSLARFNTHFPGTFTASDQGNNHMRQANMRPGNIDKGTLNIYWQDAC